MPRFWSRPLKRNNVFKAAYIVTAALLVILCGLWALAFFSMKPPKQQRFLEKFQTNRAAYEQIRHMIAADQQIRAVYVDFGVETDSSAVARPPSEVNFPIDRYRQYVALLHQVGSSAVFQIAGANQPDEACIGAWGAGWAGDARHIWICWTTRSPTNRVPNLDEYYRTANRPKDVYKQIDQSWYLRADW